MRQTEKESEERSKPEKKIEQQEDNIVRWKREEQDKRSSKKGSKLRLLSCPCMQTTYIHVFSCTWKAQSEIGAS